MEALLKICFVGEHVCNLKKQNKNNKNLRKYVKYTSILLSDSLRYVYYVYHLVWYDYVIIYYVCHGYVY